MWGPDRKLIERRVSPARMSRWVMGHRDGCFSVAFPRVGTGTAKRRRAGRRTAIVNKRTAFVWWAGVAAAVVLVNPTGAWAHASLRAVTPAFGEELRSTPSRVTLDFDQRVTVVRSAVRVLNRPGDDFARSAVADGTRVVAGVRPLRRGVYSVRWRVISADAHVVAGVWTFGVGVPAPPITEAFGAGGPTAAENLARWIWFLGIVLSIGSLAFRLVCLRGGAVSRGLDRRIAVTAGLGALISVHAGIAAFSLRGEDVLQLPFRQFLDGDLSSVAATRFGYAFVGLSLACAGVLALVFLAWLIDQPRLFVPALAVALAGSWGFSLSGHDAVDPGSTWLTEVFDWAHLASVSLWLGGLVTMALVVWNEAPIDRVRVFNRFARFATVLVAVTVAAGVELSVVRLPHLSDLWSSGYGRILLLKIGLVALALAWGAFHHFIIRPRLDAATPRSLGRIGASLRGESLVGIAVLLVTAVLVDTKPPPRPGPAGPAAVPAQVAHR